MKTRNTIFTTILLALGFFAVRPAPNAFGVTPAPDGGYSGGNTAEGQDALFSLTTGVYNTANGYEALYHNTTGYYNTASGYQALYHNTTGLYNVANGYGALFSNTTGVTNTANGFQALYYNTTGYFNTATGFDALYRNTTGASNTANGYAALYHNTQGLYNLANGYQALFSNTTGRHNTANGFEALYHNTTGSNNIALGADAGRNVASANNVICIGADGNNVDNACYIGNIFNSTSSNGVAVLVNSNGRLGTMTSSRRFKEEIKLMEQASEPLYALKPVTFRYKKEIDPAGISQFGLVAEEVEKVKPELVVRDKEGKPYSVRYDQVNAMLLNEFLKEHRTVQELKSRVAKQEAAIVQQQKDSQAAAAQQEREIRDLTASLKEQASQIQKVSAHLELSESAPRTVLNNQ